MVTVGSMAPDKAAADTTTITISLKYHTLALPLKVNFKEVMLLKKC